MVKIITKTISVLFKCKAEGPKKILFTPQKLTIIHPTVIAFIWMVLNAKFDSGQSQKNLAIFGTKRHSLFRSERQNHSEQYPQQHFILFVYGLIRNATFKLTFSVKWIPVSLSWNKFFTEMNQIASYWSFSIPSKICLENSSMIMQIIRNFGFACYRPVTVIFSSIRMKKLWIS